MLLPCSFWVLSKFDEPLILGIFVPFVSLSCMLLPSYSPPPDTTLSHLPRLLFVPIRGLSVVLRLGSLAVPAAVWRCQHGQQPRGIRRQLYVERLTVGTHQGHCIRQAGASLLQAKKNIPPNCLTTWSHAIVILVNKRENYTTSGEHQGP